MENDPYQNPFIARFLPPRDPPAISPAAVAQYLRSLEPAPQLPTLPVSAPLPDLPMPTPERSVLEKLSDATARVRKAIVAKKVNRSNQLEWIARMIALLRPLYGSKSALVKTLEAWRKEITKAQIPTEEFILRVDQVEHYLCSLGNPAVSGSFVMESRASIVPATKNVFIIHGRDETNQLRLSKMVREDFKLAPVVLLDKPGRSAPTIDKFEQHARTCSYAIALFTADDKVMSKSGEQYWQPRPNVIFETGWFVSRLGRERVLILLQEGVKIYSDFDGVNRIQFRDDVDDKFRAIRAELEASNLIKVAE
jgi:predicted nucleotide-binding protein